MGQFKPMVKMETTEPSVILKLKKGGKVKNKMFAEGGNCGHQPMQANAHAMHEAMEAESGNAPKKPSMAERRKAMNPNFKKGGKVVHKALGGALAPAVGQAVGQAAPQGLAAAALAHQGLAAPSAAMPTAIPARSLPMGPPRGSLMGEPSGMPAISDNILYNELINQPGGLLRVPFGGEGNPNRVPMGNPNRGPFGGPMGNPNRGLIANPNRGPFGGPNIRGMATGPSPIEPTNFNVPNSGTPGDMYAQKKGGSIKHKPGSKAAINALKKELMHHEALSMRNAHPQRKASGGEIDRAETRTTIESGAKKYARTKVDDGDYHDRHHGTGQIREGRPGGYATGGAIPADTKKGVNKGKIEMGDTIEDNEHYYENTDLHTATRDSSKRSSGGVRMGNAGGFADGGAIDRKLIRTTVEGGNWENRAADTAKPGKVNTRTGEVKEANAGGYRHGGKASKKAYATGGNVVNDGKAVKMPRHFVSQPVANSLQSGTFKKGGKVKKFGDGGGMDDQTRREQQGEANWRDLERQDNEADKNLFNPLPWLESRWDLLTGNTPPAGSVTNTVKSVTVTPSKKARGGRAGPGDFESSNYPSRYDSLHGDEHLIEFERKRPSAPKTKKEFEAFAESQRKQLENNPNYKAYKADKAQKAYEKHCELVSKLWK